MAWIDLTNDLTKRAYKDFQVGQVLMFDYEGSPVHIKIMRKKDGKIWGKQLKIRLLTVDEAREKADSEVRKH